MLIDVLKGNKLPWYRCTMEDENREVTIEVDVLCDKYNIADRALRFFGFYRDNAQVDNSPFTLTYDGKIDWGTESKMVGQLGIHGQKIQIGATFPYANFDNESALARGEADWSVLLILREYRNHAE